MGRGWGWDLPVSLCQPFFSSVQKLICIKEAISDTLTPGSTTVTAPSALQQIASDLHSERDVEGAAVPSPLHHHHHHLCLAGRQRDEKKENPRLITRSTLKEEANPLLMEWCRQCNNMSLGSRWTNPTICMHTVQCMDAYL